MKSRPSLLPLVCLAVLAATFAPRATSAEDGGTMTPTDTQRAYNDRGVKHMFDGEFKQAATSFKSSLSLGESNIAWLNYGRALYQLGRCEEARAAYDEVADAPAVAAPSPQEIASVLQRFRTEWPTKCNATLQLECPDEEVTVRLDSGEPTACTESPLAVTPGEHSVWVAEWDTSFDVTVTEEATLRLERPPEILEEEDSAGMAVSPAPTPARTDGSALRTAGWTLAGAGAAALATSLILEFAWVSPRFEEYRAADTPAQWSERRESTRSAQNVNRGIVGLGAAVTAAGLVLVVLAPDGRTALHAGPGTIGIAGVW